MTGSVVDDSGSLESASASLTSVTEGIRDSDSEENKKVIEEAVREIDEDGMGNFENVSVDVEDKEVVDEKLVYYETEKEVNGLESEDGFKEEKNLVSGKVDDDKRDVKLRDIIVDSSAIESLDVVDKTTLTIEEPDDPIPTAPCDGDFELDAKETS